MTDKRVLTLGYVVASLAGVAVLASFIVSGVLTLGFVIKSADLEWYIAVSLVVTGSFTLWSVFRAIRDSFREKKK